MMSAANVITFPVQTSCPCCSRACSPEEGATCYECGEWYCGRTGCSSECRCDRVAREIEARAQINNKTFSDDVHRAGQRMARTLSRYASRVSAAVVAVVAG